MSYTLFNGTIEQAKGVLASMSHLIALAENQPNATALLSARLHETMKPLTFQFHITAYLIELMLARLTGREAISMEDNISSYAEAKERIQKLQQELNEADEETVNKLGPVSAPTKVGADKFVEKTGTEFASSIVVPNMFFHLSITYAILRQEGVPLQKQDFLYPFLGLETPAYQ